MSKEAEIQKIIENRTTAIGLAETKQKLFFDMAVTKFSPMVDMMNKYHMSFLKVPFHHSSSFGAFQCGDVSVLILTSKGVGVLDPTKDTSDNSRYVEISLDGYKKLSDESAKGDLINITSYIAKHLTNLIDSEEEEIKSFYENQLKKAEQNAAGWDNLIQGLN